MSYIGNQPPDIGAYGVQSFDGGGTSFTLSKTSTNATVLLFIDGVRQTPVDAYSVSGTTLTTTATTPSGTDNVTVQYLGDVVDFGEPSDDSVSTVKIQDDAVTDAKLANSINTEIAANTAKVTNATHTGDVTGATALTIATDAVDIAMLSATGTADATTFLRGDNAWAAAGDSLDYVDVQQITSSFAGTASLDYVSGFTRGDGWDPNTHGAMSESGGVWTFPTTGYYKLEYNVWMDKTGSSGDQSGYWGIYTTPDDGTYTEKNYVQCIFNTTNFSNQGYYAGHVIFDVVSTSTHKCKFGYSGPTNTRCRAGTGPNQSYVTFSRLGST